MEGVPIIRLPGRLFPFFGFACTLSPFRYLKQLLEHTSYDVIHIHTSYISPIAWGGAYLSQKMGLPTLVTFHSRLMQFARVLKIGDAFAHWSGWQVDFSAVSEVVCEEVRPIIHRPVAILPNGIDVSFWKDLPHSEKPAEPLTIVTVMRFGPRKRGAGLVRIFSNLKSLLPRDRAPVRLVIIGDGRLRWQIQFIILSLGLKSDVVLAGFLPRSEIREVFSKSDIFILPGKIESFGISVLEACSAGLPVVVNAEGGARAFIHQEKEGLLARSDRELAECLLRLVMDDNLRHTIARHNRETWQDFDWSRVVSMHEDLYHKTIINYAHHPTN